jgi:hypothetical protein
MKERLTMHAQIERENARKLADWKEYPKTWREQVETRLLNLRIAEEELQAMREMGVIS